MVKLIPKITLFVIGLVVGGYILYRFLIPALLPFILAVVFAYLLEPLVKLLQRKVKFSRGGAIGSVLGLGVLVFGGIVSVSSIKLFSELQDLSVHLPRYLRLVQNLGKVFVKRTGEFYLKLPPTIGEAIQKNLYHFYQAVQDVLLNIISQIMNIITALPNLVIILLISLIATFFISRDKDMIVQAMVKLIPQSMRKKVLNTQYDVVNSVLGLLKAQLLLALLTAVLSFIGLKIIGSNYSLSLGIFAGVMDLLPVLGPGMVFVPWAIVAFIVGKTKFGVMLLILYILLTIIRQLLEARVVGGTLGIHPLLILIAMYAGLKLIGAAGVIIGPVILIVIRAIAKNVNIVSMNFNRTGTFKN